MVQNPQERDWRPRLSGQGTYGPLRIPYTRNARFHLWNHVAPPAAQNTLVVMKDGSVVEGGLLSHDELYGPDVHRAFIGGYDHRCDPLEDPFSFNALGLAGYGCCYPLVDIYPGPVDEYPAGDEYPQKGTC